MDLIGEQMRDLSTLVHNVQSGWLWEMADWLIKPNPEEGSFPRITVVTPSFNQAEFLEATIRSVLLQNYPNLEYMVIDGGSTDGSVEIIRRYQDRLTYWISEPDEGQCHALNKGFSMATGDWFAWLNSDDVFLPGALHTIAQTIRGHAGCDWVVGAVDFVDVELNYLGPFQPVCQTDDWLDFVCTKRKNGTALPQAGSFWSRKAWDAAGQLDETFHYAMDHEYWGRLAYHGFRPICLKQSLALFRLHPQGKTAQGERNFMADERKAIDKWLGKAAAADAGILINYQRTFGARLFLRSMHHRMNCCLNPLRRIVQRFRMAVKNNAG